MIQQKGILKVWKDDKGFGFIKPDNGEKDVFVHIRDFGNIPRKPQVGDAIHYQPMQDSSGRYRAADVSIEGLVRRPLTAKQNRSRKPNHGSGGRILSYVISTAFVCMVGFGLYEYFKPRSSLVRLSPVTNDATTSQLQEAFRNHKSDIQVTGSGIVDRILPDDREGSRHQKFILRLSTGQTVLIAHNIDLAARINALAQGDRLDFNGEYEWNRKGGVIHWTHHDPQGRHQDGWLRHNGKIYQ